MSKSNFWETKTRIGISFFIIVLFVVLMASLFSLQPESYAVDPILKYFTSKILVLGALGDFVWLWLNPKFLLQSANAFKATEKKLETHYNYLHYASILLILVGLIDAIAN